HGLLAAIFGIGFAGLLVAGLTRPLTDVPAAPAIDPNSPTGGGAGGLGRLTFTDYLFGLALTAALLIVAALAGVVLATRGRRNEGRKKSQKELVEARFRGEYKRKTPFPGPGVFATSSSVATPALLPDGRVAPESLSDLIESTTTAQLIAKHVRLATEAEDEAAKSGRALVAGKAAEAQDEEESK